MAVRIGSQAADRLSGTSAADVIYGYDPNAGTPPTMAANAIASGLVNPLYLTSAPGNSNHLFILEKRGQVKVYDAGTGQVLATPFLTVNVATDGEQGLLGLAFAPDFATSRQFYVYLSTTDGDVEIREYQTLANNPLVANPSSMRLIDRIDYPLLHQPSRRMDRVRAGRLSLRGDRGRGERSEFAKPRKPTRQDPAARCEWRCLPCRREQELCPACGQSGIDRGIEGSAIGTGIYAAGLRNPWRVSFDRLTGELYIGDVGQSAYEEINLGRPGANYGWSVTEGPFTPGSFPNFTNPIHAYDRSLGQAVTGGYVYRGPEQDFQGTYFFSDFVSHKIWSLQRASGSWSFTDLTGRVAVGGGPIGSVSSLGEDASGNLYIVDYGGKIFRLDLKSRSGPRSRRRCGGHSQRRRRQRSDLRRRRQRFAVGRQRR